MVFEGYQPGYGYFNSFGALYRPQIAYGAAGEFVAEAQKLLSEALQRQVSTDGKFGDETKAAVEEFQRQRNLPVDGVIGAATWTALIGAEVTIVQPEQSQNDGDITPNTPSRPPDSAGNLLKIALFAGLGYAAYRALRK
jgi:peptidoglycan hydrolase-like protein with peptidoglycan-binding domain